MVVVVVVVVVGTTVHRDDGPENDQYCDWVGHVGWDATKRTRTTNGRTTMDGTVRNDWDSTVHDDLENDDDWCPVE